MVQTLAVNANNDLYVDINGNIALAFDLDAVLQMCEQAVKTRLGECVLDITLGIPYLEVVFNGVPNIIQFEAAARFAILSVPNVIDVPTFITNQENNILSYTAIIITTYGEGTLNGIL